MRSRLTRPWRACLAAGAITAIGVLAGCGGSSPAAAPSPATSSGAPAQGSAQQGSAQQGSPQRVVIDGTSSLRFAPMTVHVRTGTVRITLEDMGAYPHNVVIPALGVTSATVTGDPGSDSASVTVTFKHPGRYAFHCQYHASAGMVGVFVVS